MSEDVLSPSEVAALRGQMRPWDQAGYGIDGRSTGVVDYYDGWWQGCRTDTPLVPRACNDKKAWLSGWDEGYRDAEPKRRWLKERQKEQQDHD